METLQRKDITDGLIARLAQDARQLSLREEQDIEGYADSKISKEEIRSLLAEQGSPGQTKSAAEVSNGAFFSDLKDRIRKVFCETVGDLNIGGPSGISSSGIISAVLVALVPAFAGGLPAMLLPIVVGLVALLLKKGIAAVCPVGAQAL